MQKPDSDPGTRGPSRLWLLVAFIGLTGLAVTTYLTSNAIAHSEVACSVGGCNTVLSSKWAKILGIPVSAFGMATYATIMLGSLHAFQSPTNDLRGRMIVADTAGIGVLASIYLTVIEFFVIRATCPYCLTSAALVLVAASIVIVTARQEGPLWAKIMRYRNSSDA
ncbi:MAG: vitamin K epoxide reductase family protein [Chloroflexi bacterium]|nr:vitamin K epoxide reductase family protein [Chloroflexota bacterium]